MRVVVQRISKGRIWIENTPGTPLNKGLILLVGVEQTDENVDVVWLAQKILSLRIFSDEAVKMNHNVGDVQGGIGVVSQFTLHAKTKKGTRPSFTRAATPEHARKLYTLFIDELKKSGLQVETGEFGANMQIEITNDGPVTIWLDSKNKE